MRLIHTVTAVDSNFYLVISVVAGFTFGSGTAAAQSQTETTALNAEVSSEAPISVAGEPVDSSAQVQAAAKPSSIARTTSSAPTQLEEIVVTSTKRAQSVRDVPSTIDVLTGAKLEAKGARELKDFIDLIPGIKLADQTADTPRKIAIRGVGPDDTTNQTVGTVFADVPLSDPFGSYTVVDPDPWDLKTVEVLKGPQGTLFGASSLAGLIRYVPNTPDLGHWEGRAFGEWVSVKEGGADPTFGGALNIPVGSTLAFRLAGVVQHDPGVIDIDTVGRHVPNADYTHKWSGRAMALWQPLEQLTINALYMDQQSHADELGFVTNSNGQLQRNDAPSPSPSHRAFGLGSVDIRYAFDWATLVSVSAHQHKINHFDIDSTFTLPGEAVAQQGISSTRAVRDVQANGFVQEVRLVSPDNGPWHWLGGAFYSAYSARLLSDIYAANTTVAASLLPQTPIVNIDSLATSPEGVSVGNEVGNPLDAGERALFGEVTRKFGSDWELTLGARLYETSIRGKINTGGILYTAVNPAGPNTEDVAVQSKGFSPKAALTYRVDRDILIYTTVSRGFQFGGINILEANISNDPTTFKSSTLWNYEIGIRTDWFNKTLRFDLTAFYIDWKNAQVTQEDSLDINTYVDNVGAVRSRGLENSLRYLLPIKGLSIELNGAYIDAKTTVPYTNDSGTNVPTGTEIPNSPTLQLASNLAYNHLFGPWRTQSSIEYTHSNTSWNDIEHDRLLDARNPFNLNFTVTRSDNAFSPALSLVIDNITDEKKIVAYRHGASTAGALAGTPVDYSRPRTIELRLSADF